MGPAHLSQKMLISREKDRSRGREKKQEKEKDKIKEMVVIRLSNL